MLRSRPLALAISLCALTIVTGAQGTNPGRPESASSLRSAIDPAIEALWQRYDQNRAQQHVEFVSQYWRLPGNAGYDRTIDRIQARLAEAGFSTQASAASPHLAIESYATNGRGWDHSVGTLAIARPGRADEVVLSREQDRLALCINSFSTPEGGVTARLVDVGRGDRDDDYAGKDLTGAVVLGDADAGQLWRRAMAKGAAGVVSGALPTYLNADAPGARPTPRETWGILQWSSVPYDEAKKGFGFKASPKAITTLRRALTAAGTSPVTVHVTIASTFSTNPTRTLIAEIPGTVAPTERIVIAAHVQEPGANDNASGVATLAELAVAMKGAMDAGRLPKPGRTITFLWLNEISGSQQWIKDHPEDLKNVRYMFSMDMTGEDIAKTGGSFLIERWPDPGAVWDRPWDPHSEWGRGNVQASRLKGDLINDLHLTICELVGKRTGWSVRTNPYEGGSDHTVFGNAGVPALLNWHFTDRYYHTNFDTPDKTSPAEMKNVGVAVAASAWLLASAGEAIALEVAALVAERGRARVDRERIEGAKLATADKDPTAAQQREATIVAAWRKWYAEAVRSVARLVVGPTSPAFAAEVDRQAAAFVQ